MQASAEIRRKLAMLIGSLICRCISEARMIPHVLHREEVIKILMEDPALFEKLVGDEHSGNAEVSKEDLTIRVDVARELGQLEKLEAFEQSGWEGPEVDLTPVLDSINQLTRVFAVYLGNAATLFDKTFDDFMDKFRNSLQRAGMTLKRVDFTVADAEVLQSEAMSYLEAGDFFQAFTFERLLTSQIMMKQVVNLPAEGFSLRDNLIGRALGDPGLYPQLVKFLLRISYISQGAWDDLLAVLVRKVYQDDGSLCSPARLLDFVEQDVVFCCNLLCASYAEIREWPSSRRRSALESSLGRYRGSVTASI